MAFTFKGTILLVLLATVSGTRAVTDDPGNSAIKDSSVDEVKTIETLSEVTLTVSQINETGVVTYTNTTGNKTISRQLYHTRQDTLNDGERLLGGTAATDTTTSPYAVHVNALDSDGSAVQRYCSGALISDTYVLTAASCVVDAYGITVYAGDKGGAMNDKTATAIIHPKYVRNSRENDIALLQLTTAYSLTTAINTILLPTAGTYLKAYNFLGRTFRVYGYGADLESGTPGTLYYMDTTIQSTTDCATTAATKYYKLQFNHMCLDSSFGQKGVCKGDIGAPLVAQATGSSSSAVLVAIVTDYFKCTDSSIVTRISPYLPWIRTYVSTTVNQG